MELKLAVGKAETVIEVAETAGTVVVNTKTQTISQTLTTQQLKELPTLTRNPYLLAAIPGNVSEDDLSGRGAGMAMNGLRSASTNALLDGVANNNEFTAEYGRASAGIINVTTKSSSTSFHGTV